MDQLDYYFRTKEALVLELIVEGGRLIDESRNAYLDRLEADGGPRTVREVIEALVLPAIGLAETGRKENTFIRFITQLRDEPPEGCCFAASSTRKRRSPGIRAIAGAASTLSA